MMRLREEIDASQRYQLVAAFGDEVANVGRLSVDGAGDVEDERRRIGNQLGEKELVAAFARWIYDDGRLVGWKVDALFGAQSPEQPKDQRLQRAAKMASAFPSIN